MQTMQTATLANFNCTFKVEKETKPMLTFFDSIIFPALNDKSLYRETKKKDTNEKTRYYIFDLKLINLDNGPIALIGKHIKRTILDIHPDYDPNIGFFGTPNTAPSAPYSTFIILLNNHRVIYFPNYSGAPNIKAFSATINDVIYKYITLHRKNIITSMKKPNSLNKQDNIILDYPEDNKITSFINKPNKDKYIYNNIGYSSIFDFKVKYLDIIFPLPEINVVAIESEDLVEQAFSEIASIKSVRFKFYKPNNDPIDFNNFFASCYSVLDQTDSTSLEQTLKHPQEIPVIKNAISTSDGKTSYLVNAINHNHETIQIDPLKVSQKVDVFVDNKADIESIASNTYNQLKDKPSIKEISEDNLKIYKEKFKVLFSLIK